MDNRPAQVKESMSPKQAIIPAGINAGGVLNIDIKQVLPEMYLYCPLNNLTITNSSKSDLNLYYNDRAAVNTRRILAGTQRKISGCYYDRLTIENISGTNNTAAGEIHIEVGKV